MSMVHKQRNRFALTQRTFAAFLLTFFVEFLVELDEQERLVLDISKQVMLSDEVKDIWSP